jgi:hypothetical protein
LEDRREGLLLSAVALKIRVTIETIIHMEGRLGRSHRGADRLRSARRKLIAIAWAACLGNVGLSMFPFARAFVVGFAWAVNVRWRGAAGLQ